MHLTLRLEADDRPREHDVWLTRAGDEIDVEVDGERYEATVQRAEDGSLAVTIDGHTTRIAFPTETQARIDGHAVLFQLPAFAPGGAPGEHETLVETEGTVYPPMPGKLLEVHVVEGDRVEAGDALAVLEAMKMQSTIDAPRGGTVLRRHVDEGDAVEGDELLFEIGDADLLDEA